ncbi:MAG TPA: hypothetical protein VEL76_22845, partial [Gemmataceae bacterium]|nr:hypothetical protein [Gemmataceae bacterium]
MSLTPSALAPILLETAVKGTVILAIACVAALALRRASAAVRHLVWVSALVSLLALPVLSLVGPRWHVFSTEQPNQPEPSAVANPDRGGILLRSHHFIEEPPVRAAPALVASRGQTLPAENRNRTDEPVTQPQMAPTPAPLGFSG